MEILTRSSKQMVDLFSFPTKMSFLFCFVFRRQRQRQMKLQRGGVPPRAIAEVPPPDVDMEIECTPVVSRRRLISSRRKRARGAPSMLNVHHRTVPGMYNNGDALYCHSSELSRRFSIASRATYSWKETLRHFSWQRQTEFHFYFCVCPELLNKI